MKHLHVIIIVVDIDECESNPCQNNATCNDMVDMYNCSCVVGYAGQHCETGKCVVICTEMFWLPSSNCFKFLLFKKTNIIH